MYQVERMKDGKYAVLERADPNCLVLRGLTETQADRLSEFLLRQLEIYTRLSNQENIPREELLHGLTNVVIPAPKGKGKERPQAKKR
jgi:hypothetical protein